MREIKNKKQAVRLYNIVFLPLWTWLLFPALWRVILPANFLIDSLVLAAATAPYAMLIPTSWLAG